MRKGRAAGTGPGRGARAVAGAVIGVVLGFASVLAAAGPAVAGTGHILDVQPSDGQVRIVFEATNLPKDAGLDSASVTVTVDGKPVPASATPIEGPIEGEGPQVRRVAVLAIDTSGSMRGQRLAGAQRAAQEFLTSAPPDVLVGLVTFADTAKVQAEPTTDRNAVRAAVGGLRASGSTALYDATTLAVRTLGPDGVRSIILLTDGQDEGSTATLERAVKDVAATQVRLDAVSFQNLRGTATAGGDFPSRSTTAGPTREEGTAALTTLAEAGKGNLLISANATQLAEQFRQAARALARQVVVTAGLPPGFAGGQATLTVSGTAGKEQVSDTATVLLPSRPAPPSAQPVAFGPVPARVGTGLLGSGPVIYGATALLALGLAGVVLFTLDTAFPDPARGRLGRRLSSYTLRPQPPPSPPEPTALGTSAVVRAAVQIAGQVVARRGFDDELRRQLGAAGVPLRPAEWLLVHFAVAVTVPLLLALITGGNAAVTMAGLVLGTALPFLYLSGKESRRRRQFADQLPDTLQLMAGSLSAGYSLAQAVETVVRQGTEPVAGEFNRALVETRLGVTIEDALDGVAIRMRSADWAWVVIALHIQRDVGGNLAELLTTVSATLRERGRLHRQVEVLSAEGRLSAWILGALPVVFATYLMMVRPDYITVLFKDPLGWTLLAIMALLMLIGALWMRRVVDVEI